MQPLIGVSDLPQPSFRSGGVARERSPSHHFAQRVKRGKLTTPPCPHWYYVGASFQLVQLICPVLHHLFALRQILGAVISPAQFVTLAMRKLPFDDIRTNAGFILNGTC